MNIKQLKFSAFKICFLAAAFTLTIVGTYGFGDDYVILGLAKQDNWDYLKSLEWFSSLPYNSGRQFAAIFQSIGYPFLESIDQLLILRILGVAGWLFSSLYIHSVLGKFGLEKSLRFAVSSIVFLLPGSIFLTILTASFIYPYIFLLALWISFQWVDENTKVTKPILIILAVLVSFGYQPITVTLILFPLIRSVRNNGKDRKITSDLIQTTILTYFALAINYLYIKLTYSENRLNGSIDLLAKMKLYFLEILPMIQTPHLYLFSNRIASNIVLIIFILYATSSIFSFFKKNNISKFQLSTSISKVLSWNGALFATSFWLILIPENKQDFRRLFWVSMIWYTYMIVKVSLRFSGNQKIKQVLNWAPVFLVIIWLFSVRVTTVDLQIREFNSAKCASKQYELSAESQLSMKYLLPDYKYSKYAFEDEFAVRAFDFNNPRTFLPMITNNLYKSNEKILSVWGMSYNFNGNREGELWSKRFLVCWSKIQ